MVGPRITILGLIKKERDFVFTMNELKEIGDTYKS